MADVTYRVVVELMTKGKLDAGIDSAKSKTNGWLNTLPAMASRAAGTFNNLFDNVASSIVSSLSTAAVTTTGLLVTGLTAAVKEGVRFNEQMENAQIGLAAIFQANGVTDSMQGGMRVAADSLKSMRKDARDLPGEFEDLARYMTMSGVAMAQAGLDATGMERVSAMAMATAAATGVNQHTAARELGMLLQGNARHNMPFAQAIGITDTHAFNKLSAEERLHKVNELLGKMNPAVEQFKNSWTTIKSTAIDNIKQSLGIVTGDLFEKFKDKVKIFNELGPRKAANNGAYWMDLGENISSHLVNGFEKAFHYGSGLFHTWYPVAEQFVENMASGLHRVINSVRPLLSGVLDSIQNFMQDPGAFDKIAHVAKMLLAFRGGSGVAAAGFGGLKDIAGALAGASSMAGGPAAAMTALEAAAGPAAVAVGLLALSVEGAIHILTDTSNQWHGIATAMSKDIGQNLKNTGDSLAELWQKAQPLADMLGVQLLNSLDIITLSISTCTTTLNFFAEELKNAYLWMQEHFGGKGPTLNGEDAWEKAAAADMHRGPFLMNPIKEMDTLASLNKTAKAPTHVTHIHKVEIRVNPNGDPNRVAKRTADILMDIKRNPKVAMLTGAPQVTR